MDFRFEMRVDAADSGEVGRLDRVLLDPDSREVTHIVLRTPRLSEECLISLSEIEGNVEDRLGLRVGESDLDHMPRYYAGRKSARPAQRVDYKPAIAHAGLDVVDAERVPDDVCELGPSTRVSLADGGILAFLGVSTEDPTNRLSSVTVRSGKDEYSVPAEWVGGVASEELALATTRDRLRRLVGTPGGQYVAEEPGESGGKRAA